MRLGLLTTLAAGAAITALPPTAGAYRTGPPAARTGGFGEATCAECHWGETAETGAGIRVEAPATYEPGKTYELRVVLEDAALRAAGFQLAARFAGGPGAGAQAGRIEAVDSNVVVVTSDAGVAYASHSTLGAAAPPGRAEWRVRWVAPASGGAVVFHVVGNAANDDASEFGDRIHAGEFHSSS